MCRSAEAPSTGSQSYAELYTNPSKAFDAVPDSLLFTQLSASGIFLLVHKIPHPFLTWSSNPGAICADLPPTYGSQMEFAGVPCGGM